MLFESWFGGFAFGLATTVVMLIIAAPFACMWHKYVPPKPKKVPEEHH